MDHEQFIIIAILILLAGCGKADVERKYQPQMVLSIDIINASETPALVNIYSGTRKVFPSSQFQIPVVWAGESFTYQAAPGDRYCYSVLVMDGRQFGLPFNQPLSKCVKCCVNDNNPYVQLILEEIK